VRRTKIEHRLKQGLQASSFAFDAIGFGASPAPGFTLNS